MTATTRYQSHFGVYALVLSDDKRRCLLIKKALGCYTGLLDLPGGSMEPHELLEQTLAREVQEETGCTVTSATQLGCFSLLYPHHDAQGVHTTLRHIGAIYEATIEGTPFETSPHADDSHGCIWAEIASLDERNAAPLVFSALKAANIS